MNKNQDYLLKGILKRIGITILCCIPVLVVVGFWLQDLNNVATIAIFVLIMFVVLCFEEYIHLKIATKRQLKNKTLNKNEDVFR